MVIGWGSSSWQKKVSQALYVHCFTNSFNLCVEEVSKKCDLVHNAMEFIYDLEQLLKFSPKRVALFDHLRKEVAICRGFSSYFADLCLSRWMVRGGSIENVLCNHEMLQKPMCEIQQGHDEYAAKAIGFSLE